MFEGLKILQLRRFFQGMISASRLSTALKSHQQKAILTFVHNFQVFVMDYGHSFSSNLVKLPGKGLEVFLVGFAVSHNIVEDW
jgi:hypothetical protein